MAKVGRRKQEETKSKIIGIRLSDGCHEQLMQYASEHKLTITQVVNRALALLFQSS